MTLDEMMMGTGKGELAQGRSGRWGCLAVGGGVKSSNQRVRMVMSTGAECPGTARYVAGVVTSNGAQCGASDGGHLGDWA